MNNKTTRRGYVVNDDIEFSGEKLSVLKKAQAELYWLLDREYPIKKAVEFIGNHYLLSARQRLALMRATSSTASIRERLNKKACAYDSQTIYIDGFNLIITLEVALSDSTLIKCMDGTVRDLAGLRGTYRIIDKTDIAITLIGEKLNSMNISEAVFYLDKPVSNSGRLKAKLLDLLSSYNYSVIVELADNADAILKRKKNVITSDAIILNECISWINLAADIIDESNYKFNYIDLS